MSGIRIARFGGFVNAYLVDEDDGMTLIDTTFGRGAAKAILAQAKRTLFAADAYRRERTSTAAG